MTGKVALITGASSGIGECMAYEYAKKGASLVIVARRERRLQQVAEKARRFGSPDVLVVCADVSKVDDCKRFVDETINHFGRLDHLVNNAGIGCVYTSDMDVTKFTSAMDINFWGSIYPTYFAMPHLKNSKGKIVVNASAAAVLNIPGIGFEASKAALICYYESLRVEWGSTIKITIVNLGFIESRLTKGAHDSTKEELKTQYKNDIRDEFAMMSTEPCAKAIVDGACRGERYITEPKFIRVFFLLQFFFPECLEWYLRKTYLPKFESLDKDQPSNEAKED